MKKITNIVLAPDSFKESMTSKEVCSAMEKGIKKVRGDINCIHVPMADGGEGTMNALVDATGGSIHSMKVIGPLENQITAQYGILGDNEIAVIEMASASGIQLVPKDDRNPLITTTYGTGQLIKACLDKKVKKLLIGIGGSATNDGGAGAISALGGKFLNAYGEEIGFGGAGLSKLHSIDLSKLDFRLKDVEIEVACDVTNPLCGENGASRVFGPQKGATESMIEILEENLKHYGDLINNQFGKDILNLPGAGAAGGLGAALVAFLNAKLKKGVDTVVQYSGLENKVKTADMVWTGEGSIDYQTEFGKTPLGVAEIAKKYNKPVIALAGKVGDDIDRLYEHGIDAIFSIMPGASAIDEALKNGKHNMENTAENIMRLLNAIEK
ncbi:glycerate kinase [Clostridium oryzae]|uniref:Glycerate 2-kinase n=1 Tax=Clostridium oryzae TaxID=1450648 RepID=A0A1V4IH53_9CLOT|nr:glycerate kinase [Clostridium oryzae]OPJ59283.1 glycerate 2-kinase [Clostridium oryzae]